MILMNKMLHGVLYAYAQCCMNSPPGLSAVLFVSLRLSSNTPLVVLLDMALNMAATTIRSI